MNFVVRICDGIVDTVGIDGSAMGGWGWEGLGGLPTGRGKLITA